MYIGAVLNVNKFLFELIDADDYAYMYLEKHSDEVGVRVKVWRHGVMVSNVGRS